MPGLQRGGQGKGGSTIIRSTRDFVAIAFNFFQRTRNAGRIRARCRCRPLHPLRGLQQTCLGAGAVALAHVFGVAGVGDGAQDADDGHHDHDLDQGEAGLNVFLKVHK